LKRSFYHILICLIIPLWIIGQDEEVVVKENFNKVNWADFVRKIEMDYPVRFYYNPDSIPSSISVTVKAPERLESILNRTLASGLLNFSIDQLGNVFISGRQPVLLTLPENFFDSILMSKPGISVSTSHKSERSLYMNTDKELITRTVTIGNVKDGLGKNVFSIFGHVKSAVTGEPIKGGSVVVEDLGKGTTTDENGFYTLTLKKGSYILSIKSLESKEQKIKVIGLSDGILDVALEETQYLLDEVEISSEKEHNVRGMQMGFEKITATNIKEIPVVLGERDIIKVALLLPGVQTVGEGSSGFNVRGSPADQNMFYISKIPIYNTSHLFGFFSSFDPDAIEDFKLYKSNIPATYGGRLSSIFEITTKNGNQDKFSARGGISPVSARLFVEGPIVKDTLSYLFGARSTYSDWILRSLKDPNIKRSKAYFGDMEGGFTYNPNVNNKLKLYGYYSNDQVNLYPATKYKYENIGASLAWDHSFNNRHFMALTFAYSKYLFGEENQEYEQLAFKQDYDLQHAQLDFSFNMKPSEKHLITAGLNGIFYLMNQGDFVPLNEQSMVVPKHLEAERGFESGVFLSEEWKPLPFLSFYGGLRYNMFNYFGPKTVYQYKPNSPRSAETVIDTLNYNSGELIKTYHGLDYRFAVNYTVNPDFSIKASYNRLHQYIFMLSNTIAIAPTDKWKLADYNIKPMVGDQFSLGFYSNFSKSQFEASVEAYYKIVKNQVDYRDGAQLLVNEFPERDILQGDLTAYGIEFMIKKPQGRLNGWINYTYSRALIQVNNEATGDNINFGIQYPANFDKPHAFNIVANYKLNKRLSISGNVVYSTGRPVTLPTAVYYQDGQPIINYSLKNEYRLPDYFRVDASVTFEGNLKKKKFLHGSWIFSVYNLTGRKNAYSVYFKAEDGFVSGYKLSIFGTQIFSITYDFKLGNYND
jgi:hypothetical protein